MGCMGVAEGKAYLGMIRVSLVARILSVLVVLGEDLLVFVGEIFVLREVSWG